MEMLKSISILQINSCRTGGQDYGYKDLSSGEYTMRERDANRIMQIALPICKTNVLMGSGVLQSMEQVAEAGTRNTLLITAESPEDKDKPIGLFYL